MKEQWYYDRAAGETILPFWLYVLVYGWRCAFWAHLMCRLRGHQMVGTGYGGPDTGCDGAYCERCGYEWHVTLY